MNIIAKNMNKMNTNIVITIELAYKSNGEAKERGYKDYTEPRS